MKKLSEKLFFLILLLSVAWFAQAQHKHTNEVISEQDIQAKKLEGDIALHMGTKGTKYKERYTIQIDLSKMDSVETYTNHEQMPSQLSIDQRDEIFSKLGDELPAGTDFAIWVSEFKKDNVALIMIALPKEADNIDFEGIDFVLTAGAVRHSGFYLGDPDTALHYSKVKGWTKKDGLKTIDKTLKSGIAAEVETTIFFRDKHDFKLSRNNPYREVMRHLLDGDDTGYAHIEGYSDQPSFALQIRIDQIAYLRNHPLVFNVVPNLPLPKTK